MRTRSLISLLFILSLALAGAAPAEARGRGVHHGGGFQRGGGVHIRIGGVRRGWHVGPRWHSGWRVGPRWHVGPAYRPWRHRLCPYGFRWVRGVCVRW